MAIVDFYMKAPFDLALRKYSEGGPFYLIKVSKATGSILDVTRMDSIKHWPNDFIESLLSRGEQLFNQTA